MGRVVTVQVRRYSPAPPPTCEFVLTAILAVILTWESVLRFFFRSSTTNGARPAIISAISFVFAVS